MYNEEWKNKFIEASNYKQSTEDTIRFIFEKAGKHERDFDTDKIGRASCRERV